MPKGSSNSVIVKSADRDLIEQAVSSYLRELFTKHSEVIKVIWFGSWVTGIPRPGSDVDLCLVLDRAKDDPPVPPRQRIPRYLPEGFPVGIDLFPYTEAELAEIERDRPGWFRCLTTGREVTRKDWQPKRKRNRKLPG